MKNPLPNITRSCLPGIILIVLFALISYFPILDGPFKVVFDSDHIAGNALLRDTDNVLKILTGNIFHADALYRPLTLLSHMAEGHAFGVIPYFYYLVNILLHAGCALLVYAVITLLTKSRPAGFFTALVFAVHPAHWEAVSFLSGRAVLLNTFFNLLALAACLLYMRRLNGWWMCLSLISFVCGLLSHESYLSMVTVFLFYFLCVPSDQMSKGLRWLMFLPYAVLSVMFVLIRHGLGGFDVFLTTDPTDVALRLMAAARSIFVELSLMIAPLQIHFHQTADSLQGWDDPKAIAVLVILGVILIALIVRRKKTPGFIIFLAVWFLAALWPLLKNAYLIGTSDNLLPVDGTMSYMASIPLLTLLALGTQKIFSSIPKSRLVATAMSAIVVTGFCVVTFKLNMLSTNEINLLKEAQLYEPDSAILEYDLGLTYGQTHRPVQAQAHFERAVQLDPNFTSAYMGLGKVLYEQGKFIEAAKAYESIKKAGRYASVREQNLNGIYNILILNEEAIIIKNPQDLNAYFSLGVFYDKLGDIHKSIAAYQQVIEFDPNNQAGLTGIALRFQGLIYQRLGETAKAQQNFARAH